MKKEKDFSGTQPETIAGEVDIVADLNGQDDDGQGWSTLSSAVDTAHDR
jgi:hypothetical protein